ncbi:hypothetical protein SY83_11845 [Paenibacillus swuensis]|uniref:Uncharacterized protein n=1 Tax=Paenibacillus swuensis TaxID=1178515 RepID=A0A172TIQ7_9BACL|nr:hypothetical protein [Paenibacillus swuensis]ANE46852.1 hypothetical protein SY83_11845 [Paenibacillus swuensis]
MKSRTFLLGFLAFSVLFAGLIMTFTFIFDPFQFYRKATWYEPLFSMEERFQNPGLARNYDYDTIIVGSSMTQNFVPSYVDKALGGKTMKLSMEGSTSKEHNLIANVAIRTGKVEKVIWGLDYFSLRGGADNVRDDQGGFPSFFYDENPFNDAKYLFNLTTVKEMIKIGKGMVSGDRKAKNLDMLNNWHAYAKYDADQVLKNYEAAKAMEVGFGKNEDDLESVRSTFEKNILELVRAHPEIEFSFYYPPYSVLRQEVWYSLNKKRYENTDYMRKYMVEKLTALPNAKVYDFQAVKSITFDLNVYKDISHHSQKVNEFIIDSIANDQHRATAENIDELNTALTEQVSNLDATVFDSEGTEAVKQ